MPFTSVPGSTGALQRIGNAFSTFRRNLSYASLGTEKKGALWHSATMVCGSVCVLLGGTQITCTYWTCDMCHRCARCCGARDTQNRSGFADYLNTGASCKLTSLSAFPGDITDLPLILWNHHLPTYWGEILVCLFSAVVKSKAIFLKVYLKGNELIISNLENCHHEFAAIRSYWGPWHHE